MCTRFRKYGEKFMTNGKVAGFFSATACNRGKFHYNRRQYADMLRCSAGYGGVKPNETLF